MFVLVVAWKWEGLGGLLILGGSAFFVIVNGGVQLNLVFGLMLVVGLPHLGCGWRSGEDRLTLPFLARPPFFRK